MLLSGGGGGFGRAAIGDGRTVGAALIGTASLLMSLFSGALSGAACCNGVYHDGTGGGALIGAASLLLVPFCGILSGAVNGGSGPVYHCVSGAATWLALADAPVVKA